MGEARLRQIRTTAVTERRRSGQTVDARMNLLCQRMRALITNYPLDGINLLAVCEGLADRVELELDVAT